MSPRQQPEEAKLAVPAPGAGVSKNLWSCPSWRPIAARFGIRGHYPPQGVKSGASNQRASKSHGAKVILTSVGAPHHAAFKGGLGLERGTEGWHWGARHFEMKP
jgi:hypothetical protein